jgi:hypothetical protein
MKNAKLIIRNLTRNVDMNSVTVRSIVNSMSLEGNASILEKSTAYLYEWSRGINLIFLLILRRYFNIN